MLIRVSNHEQSSALIDRYFLENNPPIGESVRLKIKKDLLDGFGEVERRDGTPYVGHLIRTAQNMQDYGGSDFDTDSAQGGLLHDSPEDILHHSIEYVRDTYGFVTGLLIASVTKPNAETLWNTVRNDEKIQKHWKKIKGRFKGTSHPGEVVAKPWKETPHKNLIPGNDDMLAWMNLQKALKEARLEMAFGKFQNFALMHQWIQEEIGRNTRNTDGYDTQKIARQSFLIKGSDRKDNIDDTVDDKKIQEGMKFILPGVREVFPDLGRAIEADIRKVLENIT